MSDVVAGGGRSVHATVWGNPSTGFISGNEIAVVSTRWSKGLTPRRLLQRRKLSQQLRLAPIPPNWALKHLLLVRIWVDERRG